MRLEVEPVTMCAAAIASVDDHFELVIATDMKITTGYTSGDMQMIKFRSIHSRWIIMFAGKISMRHELLQGIARRVDMGREYTGDSMGEICKDAFVEYQRKLSEEKILSPFGMTLDQFISSRNSIGDSLYERTWGDISRVRVDIDLLVVGYHGADQPFPYILQVSTPTEDNPSFVTRCDSGFGAVGTGAYLAESVLYSLGQMVAAPLSITVYNLAAAKFTSESASDVGRKTVLGLFKPDGRVLQLSAEFVEGFLRKEWGKHGRPHLRSSILTKLIEGIDKQTQPMKV
jgi:hypothetical protein